MKFFKKQKSKVNKSFESVPFLKDFKAKECYVFFSDYFKIDNYYATIMSYFHTSGADDGFGAFWGINKIPSGMKENIVTVNFEQISRMGEGWISSHQKIAEGVAQSNSNSQAEAGTNTTKFKAKKAISDLEVVAEELNNGASYLNVHSRLLIKAPTLEELDEAVSKIERLYTDRFSSLWVAPYTGEQRQEMSSLFKSNEKKRGKGFYFTSTELAGSYSLVTHGIEDAAGEYIGYMQGDVNNSAVLFDVNNYEHHVVVGTEQYCDYRVFNKNLEEGRARVSDMWASKLGQACLLDNGRVVHIIMNGADLNKLGPEMKNITYRIDMNKGDVNMFEMFGKVEDELSIYAAQMQKLILMAEQAYEPTDQDRSVIRNTLEKVATSFYIGQNMWRDNAQMHRDDLRVVGLPHKEVPMLEDFVTYLSVARTKVLNQSVRDDEELHALNVLSGTFENMLSSNGDLFNGKTSDTIDGVANGKRCVYDFSQLMRRGRGIAMAQLVNVIGFAVSTLQKGDTVIIHGAELIDKSVRDYINAQFAHLYDRGGRVAFCYGNLDKMLDDQEFNNFDKADYTVLGTMSNNIVARYEKSLGAAIPPDLQNLVTAKDSGTCYIRRGFDNVVFHQDLQLVPYNKDKVKKKRKKGGI